MPEPVPIRQQETIERQGLGYVFRTAVGLTLSVDYLKRRGDELHGVLTIESRRPGDKPHIHEATHNFTGLSARASLAKYLSGRVPDVDWLGLLEKFCVGVARRANTGEPFVKIGRRPKPDQETQWAIEDMVPHGAMTWWYGARASCKSQTAALIAICKTEGIPFLEHYCPSGRVAILDYEDSADKWEGYLQAIARGLDIETPEVLYRHCTVPLVKQINHLAKMLDSEDVDFLIVDSFGMAGGASGEYRSSEEVVMNVAEAIKELDRTTIMLDHISQAARLNPSIPADPINSQYKMALARAGYELRMDKEEGAHEAHVGIFDRKHRMQKAIGVLVRWHHGSITFETEDMLASDSNLAREALSGVERILFQLHRGAMTVSDLAERLDLKPTAVRSALNRARSQGKVDKTPDDRWSLSARSIYSNAQEAE